MALAAGKLRHRITVQQSVKTTDAGGGFAEVWTDVKTVYASVEPLHGREYWHGYQVATDVTHAITVRFDPAYALTSKLRVLFGSRAFDVRSVLNRDERSEALFLMAVEQFAQAVAS